MDILIPKHNLSLSRYLLPQIGSRYNDFLKYLKDNNIHYKNEKIPAKTLYASQGEFDIKKVQDIVKKPKKKLSIIVSKDNYILDGHHNWLAAYNQDDVVNILRVDALILDLISIGKQFAAKENIQYKEMENNKPKGLLFTMKKVIKENNQYSKHKLIR